MTTNQEGKHAAVRDSTGTARSYNEDWHALFDGDGIAAGSFNSRMLAWINATLSASYTNVNEAMQAFAVDQGFANWDSMNTFTVNPEWVQLAANVAPTLDIDYDNNRAYASRNETTPAAILTVTRSGTNATYINAAGLLTTVGANTLRTGTAGATIEPAATNVVLWNRDLTNAAWTKTNCTAAKDQTGIDGTASAASSLTATAGNATCLQAITLASASRVQSAFVKRITGSGTVEMTTDNGTTWTAVTVTAAWTRVDIPAQTLANPTVGFRIVTSGDAIAIDYVQNEASILTTPILTTTAAATRNADTVNLTDASLLTGATALTVMAIGSNSTPATGINQTTFQIDNSSVTVSSMFMRQTAGATAVFARDTASVIQMNDTIMGISATNRYRRKHLFTMATNNATAAVEDGTNKTDTSCTLPVTNRISIGGQNGSSQWGGNIHRFTIWKTGLTTAQLQDLSAAQNDLTILAEGDSITAGSTYWVTQLRTIAPGDWWTHNVAVSNSSINNATAAFNINSTTRKSALDALRVRYAAANPDRPVITTIFTGHNELATDGNSAATFLAELEAYCDERRAAGHVLVVVPPTPSTTAGMDAFRATVSAAIATWVGTHADYVVDWTGVSGMLDADASNTALWVDGIHPSTAQALVMAQAMKTQVFDVVAAL